MSDLHIAFTVPVNNYPLELPTATPRTHEFSKDIIAEVARRHGVTPDVIRGGSRVRRVVRIRHEAMWEIRKRTSLSLPQIARAVGLNDHTSALHGIRAHEERMG